MGIRSTILNAGAALLLSVSPAFACKGRTVLFSDNFPEADSSRGDDPYFVTTEVGRLKIKSDADSGYMVLYPRVSFDIFDYCVTVRMPNNVDPSDPHAEAGLVFWASDGGDFFVMFIDAGGLVSLRRVAGGRWMTLLEKRGVKGVRTGDGARNVLRVTAAGDSLTLFANDVRIASVRAARPDGAGQIGVHALSGKARRDAWKFSDLIVTDVTE